MDFPGHLRDYFNGTTTIDALTKSFPSCREEVGGNDPGTTSLQNRKAKGEEIGA
jgi:hypothetical protein